MSILNVNQIQPVGSGQTITVSASDIAASSATVTANNFTGNVTGNVTGNINATGISTFNVITGVSTIGVTTIHVTGINDLSYPTAGPLSNRNLIQNGAMQVSQRGTSFTSNGYCVDRFKFTQGPAGFTVTQSSTAPEGFSNSVKFDCTSVTTPTGTEEIWLQQVIEAQNLQHLEYGSSTAKSLTVSFWVRSNKTGDFGLWFYRDDAAKQYATTYTINSADTWEYKTITIPGDTAGGTINNDNGQGLVVRFYLGAGGNYAGTPAEVWTTTLTSDRTTSMNLADSLDNEWYVTGLQLEVGTRSTPFEHRSYGEELALCQRYCQSFNGRIAIGNWNGGTGAVVTRFLNPPMRATPTFHSYTAGNCLVEAVAWYSVGSVVIQGESTNSSVTFQLSSITNSGQSFNANATWGNGAAAVIQADL